MVAPPPSRIFNETRPVFLRPPVAEHLNAPSHPGGDEATDDNSYTCAPEIFAPTNLIPKPECFS